MTITETNFKYRKPLVELAPNQVKYIIVHHIAMESCSPERLHDIFLGMGYSGFAYNDYIRKDGRVYIGRGNYIGQQCYEHNSISYGVAVEGNYSFEKDVPGVQFKALVERIKQLKQIYPNAVVVPHNDRVATECPGLYFPFDELLKSLSALEEPTEQRFFYLGKELELETKLIEDTNYVKLRDLANALGHTVHWDAIENKIYFS